MASSDLSNIVMNLPGLESMTEVEKRALLMDVLIREYEKDGRRKPQHLTEAIEQGELVLRRLPPGSATRVPTLNRLSYAHMSVYVALRSQHALNEAVRCGQLARQEALIDELPTKDPGSYCDILNNLGVALSYRSHANVYPAGGSGSSRDDLDRAIECAREAKNRTSSQQSDYNTSLANLASRLTHRYSSRGDVADQTEAVRLLEELQARTGQVPIQLVNLAVDKCNKTGTMEDLSDAIKVATAGLSNLPAGFEGKPEYLRQLTVLYMKRFKKMKNSEDIESAILHSRDILKSVSTAHVVRGGYLLNHMVLLREYAYYTMRLSDVTRTIEDAKSYLGEMGDGYAEQQKCRQAYGDLLGRKFLLSRKLPDLAETVVYIKDLSYDYNEEVRKAGTKPLTDTSLMQSFASHVSKLNLASLGVVKERATKKMHEQLFTACQSGDFVNALLRIGWKTVHLLEVYAAAAQSGELISDADAQRRSEELQRKNLELERGRQNPRWKPNDYSTEFGLRSLAIDPTNNRIVMDMSGFLSGILGYDATKQMTPTEFKEAERGAESRSVEKVKRSGKRPNPNICYMCRLIKPLCFLTRQSDAKITRELRWNPKIYFPLGNWHQLKLRKCSICQLILSLIATDRTHNALHSRLATIDREIQGISLHAGAADSGEQVLIVEYGMRAVGELRLLSYDNAPTALRQAWEAESPKYLGQGLLKDEFAHQESFKSVAGQKLDVQQLKAWLAECDETHGQTCNSTIYGNVSTSRAAVDVPILLVDVVDNRLVRFSTAAKYFALSYVWGQVDMSATTKATSEARVKPGGLPEKMPDTISDAIALVRSLGERYLWCDNLCIVQDDETHKAQEIANMDIVYSKAFATIVALHGIDANAGLPGIRPGTRPLQRIEKVIMDSNSDDMDFTANAQTVSASVIATPRRLQLTLEASRWDGRGWTFQERLLSRRSLYFSESYVYFQCGRRDAVRSECGVTGLTRPKDSSLDGSDRVAVINALDNPLADLYREVAELAPDARLVRSFTTYSKLVEQYTRRQLSHDTDIIDAFQGSLNFLNDLFPGDPLCGLPGTALDLALLWTPADRIPRRSGPGPGLQADLAGRPVATEMVPTNRNTGLAVFGPREVQTFDDKVDRRFPSWSWAGWKGHVEYRFFSETPAEEPLPMALFRNIAINLNGGENREVKIQADTSIQLPQDPVAEITDRLDLSSIGSSGLPLNDSPKLPNVLQFMAPCVALPTFTLSKENQYISKVDHIHASGEQAVRHIFDRRGKRCGLWWEQAGYVYVGRGVSPLAESKMLFVGISEHKDTFRRRQGPNRVEGEIKLFDEEVYPAVGQGSGLVNVLAVDLDMGHDYAERVTVARIHAKAWEDAAPVLKMVRLA